MADALFVGYLQAGSELQAFVKEKIRAAIALRDRYLAHLDLKKTLSQMSEKIEQVKDASYSFDSEDRAKLVRFLQTTSQVDELNRIQNKNVLTETDREIYLDLLRGEYKRLARGICVLQTGLHLPQRKQSLTIVFNEPRSLASSIKASCCTRRKEGV